MLFTKYLVENKNVRIPLKQKKNFICNHCCFMGAMCVFWVVNHLLFSIKNINIFTYAVLY